MLSCSEVGINNPVLVAIVSRMWRVASEGIQASKRRSESLIDRLAVKISSVPTMSLNGWNVPDGGPESG